MDNVPYVARSTTRSLPPATVAALAFVALALPVALPASAGGASPQELATKISDNDAELRAAIDAWREDSGDPPAGQAPQAVMEPALWLQRKVRFLARHQRAGRATVGLLEPKLERQVFELTGAAVALRRLAGSSRRRKLRTGKPRPLAELMGHYSLAEDRHGVASHYLAAINLVETKFGRVKSKSVAGARGPMQFLPSTWRIYGNGGDIQDPRDAVLAAARMLRDSGAPRSYSRALYAYNPSKLYVRAVSIYAGLIARDPYAIHVLYCWGP